MIDPISIAMGLAQFAPAIMRWLGSSDKAASAAEDVIGIATQVTGAATGRDALAALGADPTAVLEFRRALAEREADLDKAYLLDVQHARVTNAHHWMPSLLTIALAAMVTALVTVLVYVPMPADNKEVIFLIAGQVIGAFSTAIAYWLGSSRGSAQKNDEISAIMTRLNR